MKLSIEFDSDNVRKFEGIYANYYEWCKLIFKYFRMMQLKKPSTTLLQFSFTTFYTFTTLWAYLKHFELNYNSTKAVLPLQIVCVSLIKIKIKFLKYPSVPSIT